MGEKGKFGKVDGKAIDEPVVAGYPYAVMEVGDWFASPEEKGNGVRAAASGLGKKLGKKFSVNVVSIEGERCIRCVRVM